MQKTTFLSTLSLCATLLSLAALAFAPIPSSAQGATPSMPRDPKELMLLASKTNGLSGDDVKPWHIKASWKLLDESGSVSDQGTYEEFYVSPKKFKRTFTGMAFTQSYYRTEKDFLRSGVQKLPSELISDARREFVEPMPDARTVQYMSFSVRQIEVGGTQFSCLSLDGKAIFHAPYNLIGRSFCLDTEKPILRISTSNAELAQYQFANFQSFQGRTVAGELKIFQDGKLALTAQLETLEPFVNIQEVDFTPPPDATPAPHKITLSAGVAQGFLLKHDNPVYPKNASSVGTVIVHIVVDSSGRIVDAKFLEGPPELRNAALDCVRKWSYRPYILNGQPVEVDTTVNMVFTR